MHVDIEHWHAEIGNFNGSLRYTFVKLKLDLFSIMLNVSQVLTFILAIIFQGIFKATLFFNI